MLDWNRLYGISCTWVFRWFYLFVSFSSGNPSEESQHRHFGVFLSAFLLLFVVVVLREVMFILICEWSVHNKLRYLISVRDDRFFVFRDSSRPSPKCSPFLFITPARDTALYNIERNKISSPRNQKSFGSKSKRPRFPRHFNWFVQVVLRRLHIILWLLSRNNCVVIF